ncbi:MAG: magnesium transporter [Verrucomicrobiota bacterium]
MPSETPTVQPPDPGILHISSQTEAEKIFVDWHPADIAETFADLEEVEKDRFLSHLDEEMAQMLMGYLDDHADAEMLLHHFPASQQREILESIGDDDRVDFLQNSDDESREHFLSVLSGDAKEQTESLLQFPEDSAGGRMTTEVATIGPELTASEAFEELRSIAKEAEVLARVYVVDDRNRLLGRLRLRDLIFAEQGKVISEIMQSVRLTIDPLADQEEAAKMVQKYDLVTLPVVDENRTFLGCITHDDAVDILEQESTEDIEQMAAISPAPEEVTYLETKIWTHLRRRFPWVLGLAFLAIVSGWVMIQFEAVLTGLFQLALYLPMVVAAGGNTGGQASTMVIRAMSVGELAPSAFGQVLWKELRLGVFMGTALGLCIALQILVFLPGTPLPESVPTWLFGVAVAAALALQVTTSTLIGAALPLVAKACKIDPAVVASPAITTLVDVSGLAIYFVIANAVLGI